MAKSKPLLVTLQAKLVPGRVYRSAKRGAYECIHYIGPGVARLRSVASDVSFRASALVISADGVIAWDGVSELDYGKGAER